MPHDHPRRTTRPKRPAVRCRVEVLERREVLSAAGSSTLVGPEHVAALARPAAAIVAPADGDVISASAPARKMAKRMLAGSSFAVEHLSSAAVPADGSVIVATADLHDPRTVAILESVYNSGRTVALTDATRASARHLQTLLGYPMTPQWPARMKRVALVAFRRVQGNGPPAFSTYIMPRPGADAAPPRLHHLPLAESRSFVASWLDRVFAATPAAPGPPTGATQNNLIDLAASYTVSMMESSYTSHNAVQITDTVYDARAFHQQQDYYYVLQEVDYNNGSGNAPWKAYVSNAATHLNASPTILQTSPPSTQPTTSTTSSVSQTISASIGFNEAQGLNVSLGTSTTIQNSTTFSFPSLEISNQSDISGGGSYWEYLPTTPQPAGTELTFYNQWIWVVPWSAYQSAQPGLLLNSIAWEKIQGQVSNAVPEIYSTVPMPFGNTFSILNPTVTGISQSTIHAGDTFNITGTGLYPALVESILIDGQPLSPDQYTTVSDTDIEVVAPDLLGTDLPVVVKTSKGDSNDNFQISIT